MPTTRQALEAMYGDEALSVSDTEATLHAPVPNYTTTVHINLMACFWESLAEKCLVVTDSAFDSCHVCQADIGGAVFQRIDGSWELAVFQPTIVSLGSFGYVPKGELIQIGPDKHAALIKSGWAGQGYEGEYATIIAEIDGSFRVVLNLLVSEIQEPVAKDGPASLGWGYSSKLEFFAGEHPDFYDLVVTQYGINREGSKFKTVSLCSAPRNLDNMLTEVSLSKKGVQPWPGIVHSHLSSKPRWFWKSLAVPRALLSLFSTPGMQTN